MAAESATEPSIEDLFPNSVPAMRKIGVLLEELPALPPMTTSMPLSSRRYIQYLDHSLAAICRRKIAETKRQFHPRSSGTWIELAKINRHLQAVEGHVNDGAKRSFVADLVALLRWYEIDDGWQEWADDTGETGDDRPKSLEDAVRRYPIVAMRIAAAEMGLNYSKMKKVRDEQRARRQRMVARREEEEIAAIGGRS
ncbi:MAG: hypothetical protein M1826_002851 [Phylliscum demangeonii]|nr:MAG: hypothetical protein M1826_002851 [Phylliscum demangeonii]